MEKTKEIKGFAEYKTNLRAVSDGVNLLGRHAWMLLKACSPLMLLLSMLWAWASVSFMEDFTQLDFAETGIPHSSLLPSLLLIVGEVVALAQFYSLFQGYVQNGFIPQVNFISIWKQTWKTLKSNTLIVWLWVLFVSVVFVALAFFLLSLSKYALVLVAPAALVFYLWQMNLVADFHVHDVALVRALTRSFGVTMRGFLSFLLVAILLVIVTSIISLIVTVPVVVSAIISDAASFSQAMGDNADLPSYFRTVCFIFSTVSGYLMLIVAALMCSCWTMVYGAVSHRSSKKYQSSAQKD